MGNCCKVVKKEKEVAKLTVDSGAVTTEDRSLRSRTLIIKCESPEFTLTLRYRPAIPLQDLKEQIVAEFPSLDIQTLSLFREDLEILDPTATLQQLGIVPGDTLEVKMRQQCDESNDIIASENNSIRDFEEGTKKHEVKNVTAKKGLAARNANEYDLTSPKKPAKELWRTALPSPPARALINCDPMDVSSLTNNTHDKSLKAPQAAFQVKVPQLMESDDSNIDDRKISVHRENLADFQDLKGPFYVFQKDS